MKDALIILLLLLLVLMGLGSSHHAQALIDDPTAQPMVKADFSTCILRNPNGPIVDPKVTIHEKGHPETT